MNVRVEIQRLSRPNQTLVDRLEQAHGDREPCVRAFKDAYKRYRLCCERLLLEWSVLRRYGNGPYYVRKVGGAFTAAQKKVARQFHAVAPFVEVDVFNAIIHARILLDRTVGLSRFFLPRAAQRPSFSSFNEHRKFLNRRRVPGITDTAYAEFIRSETEWLVEVLKEFRDHGLVHAERAAWTALATGWHPNNDLILLYALHGRQPVPGRGEITLPELLLNLRAFLERFNALGVNMMR
jgi:hypothetical protein